MRLHPHHEGTNQVFIWPACRDQCGVWLWTLIWLGLYKAQQIDEFHEL